MADNTPHSLLIKAFDNDYIYLRKLVVSGKVKADAAKRWLKHRADMIIDGRKISQAQLRRQLDKEQDKMPPEDDK